MSKPSPNFGPQYGAEGAGLAYMGLTTAIRSMLRAIRTGDADKAAKHARTAGHLAWSGERIHAAIHKGTR